MGGFAICARVSLPRQHSAERETSASACTRSIHGFTIIAAQMLSEEDDLDRVA